MTIAKELLEDIISRCEGALNVPDYLMDAMPDEEYCHGYLKGNLYAFNIMLEFCNRAKEDVECVLANSRKDI